MKAEALPLLKFLKSSPQLTIPTFDRPRFHYLDSDNSIH
jgi:hypothetical protein